MILGVYGGTPIEWLPASAANAWRFVYFIGNCIVFGQFATMTIKRFDKFRFTSKSTMVFWWVIVGSLLRSLIVQIERFGDKAVYEGLPLQTILLIATWYGIRLYKKGC